MSDIRPGQASVDDGARLLRDAARRRVSAMSDLSLPERLRLTERQRLTARTLLERLVRALEDELRAAIASRFAQGEPVHAALASAHVALAGPALAGSDALREPELVQIVLRRLDEHRIYLASRGDPERLHALVADRDPQVAADAMAVLVARSRRLDRFEEPAFTRTELPAELQHRLVWTVAAALRTYLIERHGVAAPTVDALLGEAAGGLLAGYDESDRLEARCERLARRLRASDRLDGATLEAFLAEGTLPLFIAGLSAATGIAYAAAWDLLSDPAGQGAVLLLRAAGLDRQQAAQCLLTLADLIDDDRLVEQIALFDASSAERALATITLWSLDPVYREMLLRLRPGAAVS